MMPAVLLDMRTRLMATSAFPPAAGAMLIPPPMAPVPLSMMDESVIKSLVGAAVEAS
jgi:hypothetical protein